MSQSDIEAIRSEMATKKDLDNLRIEIKKDMALRFIESTAKMEKQVDSVHNQLKQMESRITKLIDNFAKRVESDNKAMTIHGKALSEHADILNGHEKRLVKLEKLLP